MFRKALLIGLTIILTGCVTTECPTMPAKPTKPTLESIQQTSEGGMILSKDDAQKLGIYILELERGYNI
ncbi:MAG: hypothetical protein CME82_11420 [Halomonas sp.]|nr:hypothetical protein [Halomonas sp.]